MFRLSDSQFEILPEWNQIANIVLIFGSSVKELPRSHSPVAIMDRTGGRTSSQFTKGRRTRA